LQRQPSPSGLAIGRGVDDKLRQYRVFPRLFAVFYLFITYEVTAWFMSLSDPSNAQAGMVSTLHDDYVITAEAKGLASKAIRDRHAARNASLAVVARLAVSIPYLLTGLVIIETAVGFSGVGDFLFTAIDSQDVPLAVSTLAVIGAITMVVRLVLDILIAVMDPRIVVGRAQV